VLIIEDKWINHGNKYASCFSILFDFIDLASSVYHHHHYTDHHHYIIIIIHHYSSLYAIDHNSSALM